ncbi:MAG: Snf7 family protein [Nitrososphaerales archaeon]
MSEFTDKWVKSNQPSAAERIKEAFQPAAPLKPKIEQARRQLQAEVQKMDSILSRLKKKDEDIFKKSVAAVQNHDTQLASALSNELAEIRKMSKLVHQARLALEQISLRLTTVQDLGDIAVTLAPAASIVRSLRSSLTSVLPEAEGEMGEISGLLSNILVEVGQLGGLTLNFEAANEEAEKILAEASAVAEQRMKEAFPNLPAEAEHEGSNQ